MDSTTLVHDGLKIFSAGNPPHCRRTPAQRQLLCQIAKSRALQLPVTKASMIRYRTSWWMIRSRTLWRVPICKNQELAKSSPAVSGWFPINSSSRIWAFSQKLCDFSASSHFFWTQWVFSIQQLVKCPWSAVFYQKPIILCCKCDNTLELDNPGSWHEEDAVQWRYANKRSWTADGQKRRLLFSGGPFWLVPRLGLWLHPCWSCQVTVAPVTTPSGHRMRSGGVVLLVWLDEQALLVKNNFDDAHWTVTSHLLCWQSLCLTGCDSSSMWHAQEGQTPKWGADMCARISTWPEVVQRSSLWSAAGSWVCVKVGADMFGRDHSDDTGREPSFFCPVTWTERWKLSEQLWMHTSPKDTARVSWRKHVRSPGCNTPMAERDETNGG